MANRTAKEPPQRSCFCSNDKCEEGRLLALQVLNPDHPWCKNNGLTEVKHSNPGKPTEKVEALRRACTKHLSLSPAQASNTIYYVATIHWPLSVLESRSYLSTPIKSTSQRSQRTGI